MAAAAASVTWWGVVVLGASSQALGQTHLSLPAWSGRLLVGAVGWCALVAGGWSTGLPSFLTAPSPLSLLLTPFSGWASLLQHCLLSLPSPSMSPPLMGAEGGTTSKTSGAVQTLVISSCPLLLLAASDQYNNTMSASLGSAIVAMVAVAAGMVGVVLLLLHVQDHFSWRFHIMPTLLPYLPPALSAPRPLGSSPGPRPVGECFEAALRRLETGSYATHLVRQLAPAFRESGLQAEAQGQQGIELLGTNLAALQRLVISPQSPPKGQRWWHSVCGGGKEGKLLRFGGEFQEEVVSLRQELQRIWLALSNSR